MYKKYYIIFCALFVFFIVISLFRNNLKDKCNYSIWTDSSYVSVCYQNDTNTIVHPFFNGKDFVAVLPFWIKMSDIKIRYTYPQTQKGNIPKVLVKQTYARTIYIETEHENIRETIKTKEDKEKGYITVFDAEGNVEYKGGLTKIKGRGNMSWYGTPKKSYNIELDRDVSILGLDENKDYCLLANAFDPTSLRNYIALTTGRELGVAYTPKCEFVQLFVDKEYMGLYLVTNKIKVGRNGVKITNLEKATKKENKKKLKKFDTFQVRKNGSVVKKGVKGAINPKDITGGYLLDLNFKLEAFDEVSGFIDRTGMYASIKSPKYATKQQVEYISRLYDEILCSVADKKGINNKTHKAYYDYLDVESYSLYFLLQEFYMNMDANKGSFWQYKDIDSVDGKMYAGPLWDFDNSMLIEWSYLLYERPNIFLTCNGNSDGYKFLMDYLCCHEEFMDGVKNCYVNKLRPYLLTNLQNHCRDSVFKKIEYEACIDGVRWHYGISVHDEIERLNAFLNDRLSFFDYVWIDKSKKHSVLVETEHSVILNEPFLRTVEFVIKDGDKFTLPKLDREWDHGMRLSDRVVLYDKETGSVYNQSEPVHKNLHLEIKFRDLTFVEKMKWYKSEFFNFF